MIKNLSIIIDHFKPQILFVFFFRFIRCVFCIVYLDPIHSLSLCMCPLPLHTTPQIKQNSREKKKENKMKKNFKKEGLQISSWNLQCDPTSHTV